MNYSNELKVLAAGIASRLHITRRKVLVDYFPSSYGGNRGARDESAEVMVRIRPHPNNVGARIKAAVLDGMPVDYAADEFANLLKRVM